ncbi:AAA family ATPase [Acidithiobacillus albertensis]|uniref:AAA family ATPase n=1 Tax=Acidithiobacillus albertensis TaxID=119978 RepID=UPI00094AD491|nr:AAA family ATPase [Acidithiobacillus albertensis]
MNSALERFRIIGLHGRKTVDVAIRDNTLVLVGENGSGKTTFLRILFHFLSGRWFSLVQFRFGSIVATIGGVEYKVSHEELVKAFKGIDRRFLAEIPPLLRRRVMELLEKGDIERVGIELERAGGRYSIPPEVLLRQLEFFEEPLRGSKKELQETISRIQEAIRAQILYLPTYRRIERELNSIFEGVDPDDFRRQRNRLRQNNAGEAYIELVEFGMKDVQQAVDRTLERLKEFVRENLNKLTLGYLGDVVNREYLHVEEIADISEDTVRSVLDRIHESILTKEHKEHLFGVINSARSANAPTEHEKIIYHYFLKLLGFQQSLQEKERQISAFCELCSEYIVDKRFVYDSQTFSFSILPEDDLEENRSITLSDLSSGEKQIVSLFSHLYLSGQQNFFVLIDEPELSLSVPWQRRFLKDIRAGQFCKGLVAVTHSPFIYDNDLRPYTHSLGEFVSL